MIAVLLVFLALFILYPLLMLLVDSFYAEGSVTLDVFKRVLNLDRFKNAFKNTLVLGFITGITSTAIGLLFAYVEVYVKLKTRILEKLFGLVSMNLEYYMQLDPSENKYVSRAIEEIKSGYWDKLSVESISDKLGVSASYLSRKFKEVTGQTFLDFLNKYRISQAINLLNTGQYRIGEVSDATGFTDYKHFCAVFKKYTLKSPTKFMEVPLTFPVCILT